MNESDISENTPKNIEETHSESDQVASPDADKKADETVENVASDNQNVEQAASNAAETGGNAEPKDFDDAETHVTVVEHNGCKFHIIGTAHVSEQSRQEVRRVIDRVTPDVVCVELDQERYDSFYDTDRWKKLDIFQVIKKGKFLYLLANLMISAYQRRIGAVLGVKPGAELIGAAEDAKAKNIPVSLIDRNINITLKRVWANQSFWNKCELLGEIFESLFGDDESKEETAKAIEELKQDSNLSSMVLELAKQKPQFHLPLIDERDRYLMAKMRAHASDCKNVVAVVGAGHVPGIVKYFNDEVDTDALDQLPKPSIVWKLVKWLIPIILFGGIAYGLYSHGFDSLQDMLKAWILPNSVFCLITAIIAFAHPLTILASIFVSPLTSTTPVIGAGIVLGLLEAWLRKPTVADCEALPNVHTVKDFYKNKFTHVLIVCVLTTFGSAAGAWIGIGWLLVLLGLE
ncbi:MAG: TraB/GumN family protein [Proteobacteria bacterium]|nr:TraB/GumN family protein [Pseudomonadota bacterium]